MDEAVVLKNRSELESTTPMMQQYLDIRAQYEGYVLMYRLGDFYECFFEDAVVVSRELELTLTARDCGNGKRAAMCGVPFHKSDLYVGRLVERGYKVAICEQIEDPKEAVGLVKRDVIRVVTPGTQTDDGLLTEGKNNYLLTVCYGRDGVGLAFADITTAEVTATYIPNDHIAARLCNEVGAFAPAEAILNIPPTECTELSAYLKDACGAMVSCDMTLFDYTRAKGAVREVFHDDADKLSAPECLMATGALVAYIRSTQKSNAAFARELTVYEEGQYLQIDSSTRRNLELVESMRGKDKRGTLLWTLDRTETAMGARLLRSWILQPLINPVTIGKRQSAVADLLADRRGRDTLGEALAPILDIERLTAKTVYATANAKDLHAIGQSLCMLPTIRELIASYKSPELRQLYDGFDTVDDLCELLTRAIVDTPPFSTREGGMIRPGFDEDIDYYRTVKENGAAIMQSIEEREREMTGIRTLKVSYNKVFGYYIEVTKSLIDQVPDRYIRKQTLTNCERYITQELKEMESTILSADERIVELEYAMFCRLRESVAALADRIRSAAHTVAALDVYRSFAECASRYNYTCPEVDLSSDLIIKDGRHPVVEKFVTGSYFVPNDTKLNTDANRMMIITGPNMAGKSTYMRQVALIVLMAQIGSYVPAASARIGVVDKIFTRVGASDDLASGQSTFMLEMTEVAAILKHATRKSLIVYDEVGRGTSTYDGMAIARAVVEYTHSPKIGARTLFATHYHELVALEDELDGVVNYNIAAKKRADSITFLRKIVRGGTDDSYGIEVAKLAGVPAEVVRRAKAILADIEGGRTVAPARGAKKTPEVVDLFTELTASHESEVAERLRGIDLNTLTPLEAMNLLFELKGMLS